MRKQVHKIKEMERQKVKMKIIIAICVIFIIAIIISMRFFGKNEIKNVKIGNNNSSQEIVDNILNISSYEAVIEMTVYSNKNENKYKIKQLHNNEDNSYQEIIEPSNIAGIKIIQEANKLTIENSKLNLSNIIENYKYIADNCIDLSSFIKDYKQDTAHTVKEEDNSIILETISNGKNKYIKYKTLKIDKKTGKPIQMEIKADNKNTTVYILYNEVKISGK